MKLNRSQKRFFNLKSTEGKSLRTKSFMNEEKIDSRKKSCENGRQQSDSFTRAIQEKHMEQLSNREIEIIQELKLKKVSQECINEYIEIWSSINTWPKPSDYQTLRKKIKKTQ